MLKIAYHPSYRHSVPVGHRFPMVKYELLPEQLLYEGTCTQDNFFTPTLASEDMILLTHDTSYYQDLLSLSLDKAHVRRIGFELSDALVDRERYIMQGSVDAALYALRHGVAFNIAGGTHHAFADRGEGFCLLNDNAIVADYLLHHKLASKVLIIDLDVHQGNGTASIFRNKEEVFTFSMHGRDNFPFIKEKSDLDIPLPMGCDDDYYLNALYQSLPKIIDSFQPDFICYQCGVDILYTDKMGKLSVTLAGCSSRDRFVLSLAHRHKIPIVANMGGGYSEDIKIIVEAHANTYRLAQEIFF